ncbi:MAG: ADP-ribosylglycohydrolase family protein [Deltaproteobacteria bacterium]|jgi:hypothetical protein|nr:ADP-ribosylglycohydrolase family protein [Deltaproteobacteria bacterium]
MSFTIIAQFGPKGITNYVPAYGRLGAVTDDTQMTLFTAEGLLRTCVRSCYRGITTVSGVTELSYKRWLYTQEHTSPPTSAYNNIDLTGWLISVPELYSRRSPDKTNLSDAKNGFSSIHITPADNFDHK